MKVDKFILGIAIFTVAALVVGIFLLTKVDHKVEANPLAKAEVTKTSAEWGDIPMHGGDKVEEFGIKNTGKDELLLSHVITSCMCTTASLSLGDETSPEFGMHGKSSYIMKVPAGQEAKLTVKFDPAYHGPSGLGPITRQIKVETSDPENPTLSFMLTGNVIDN